MGKRAVMTSIDDNVHKLAKDAQLNISAVLEDAIRKKLNVKDVEIPMAEEKCFECKQVGPKETADEIRAGRNNPRALTWLWPDETWICNSCLKRKMVNIAH